MSEDVLGELVQKTLHDKEFKESALRDLDGTLAKYGYTTKLTAEELSAIREFHAQNRGLSPEELHRRLTQGLASKKQYGY